jgi:Mce-associated membrane protein
VSTDQKLHSGAVDVVDDGIDATDTDTVTEDDDHTTDTLADSEPAEDVAEAEAPAKRRRLPSMTVGIAALGVLLVAAASVTAWLYFAQFRPAQATGPEAAQSALQAAQEGTVALLSYKPDTLDADLAAAKSHLTGEFLTYYTQFTDQIVKPAAAQKKVQTTANVVRAAVSDIAADTADVLVFVNQTTTSTDRPDPTMANSSVLVHLTKVDGRWLISEFKPV